MSDCDFRFGVQDKSQKKILIILLLFNACMFVLEFGLAWSDLVVGALIAIVILKGGRQIVRDAREEMAAKLSMSTTDSCG